MSWAYLFAAIVLEVCGTICMKLSQGLTRLVPSLLLLLFYGLSFGAMTLAIKRIEVSTAYAIWSGLGTALIAVAGILSFKESASFLKLASLAFVILGIIGLNLAATPH